jgi:hypothetical protein
MNIRILNFQSLNRKWYYANQMASATVTFFNEGVYAWSEP